MTDLHYYLLPPVPLSTLPACSRTWQQAPVARPSPNMLPFPRQPSALLVASCTRETCLAAPSGTQAHLVDHPACSNWTTWKNRRAWATCTKS